MLLTLQKLSSRPDQWAVNLGSDHVRVETQTGNAIVCRQRVRRDKARASCHDSAMTNFVPSTATTAMQITQTDSVPSEKKVASEYTAIDGKW